MDTPQWGADVGAWEDALGRALGIRLARVLRADAERGVGPSELAGALDARMAGLTDRQVDTVLGIYREQGAPRPGRRGGAPVPAGWCAEPPRSRVR
jgi:hypothetical protein